MYCPRLRELSAKAAEDGQRQVIQNVEDIVLTTLNSDNCTPSFNHLEVGTVSDNARAVDEDKHHTIVRVLKQKDGNGLYESLKTFHETLAANKIPNIKTTANVNGSKYSFMVTRPGLALLHIFYNVFPAYVMVQDFGSDQSQAMSVMETLVESMKTFGLQFEREQESTMWEENMPFLSQNNVDETTINQVKERRGHLRWIITTLQKSGRFHTLHVEQEEKIVKLQKQLRSKEEEQKFMETEHNEKVKIMVDNKKQEIIGIKNKHKTTELDNNNKLKNMETVYNKKIKKMRDDHNRQLKIMRDEHDQINGKATANNDKLRKRNDSLMRELRDSRVLEQDIKSCRKEEHSKNDRLRSKNNRLQKQLDDVRSRLEGLLQMRAASAPSQTSIGTQVWGRDATPLPLSANPNQENQQHAPNEYGAPVQETNRGSPVRLSNPPPEYAHVERRMYHHYYQLVLILSGQLQMRDTGRFRRWARDRSGIEINQDVLHVCFQLDEIGVISESNLDHLVQFLQDIQRNDLVRLVHQFQRGNYTILYRVDQLLGNPNNQHFVNEL